MPKHMLQYFLLAINILQAIVQPIDKTISIIAITKLQGGEDTFVSHQPCESAKPRKANNPNHNVKNHIN